MHDQARSTDDARYHVPSLARALRIVELLAKSGQDLGITEIAERLDLPKNSVFRITATLHDYGYLQRDPDRKSYALTRKLLALGHAAIDQADLLGKAHDIMQSLRDSSGETVLLGTLTGHEGVVLDQLASPQAVKVLVELGHRFPLHTAAPAKAMLAYLPADELAAILGGIEYPRFTPATIDSAPAMSAELESVRTLGYARDRGEEMVDVHCLAAPIFNHRGQAVASIWITGPKSRFDVTTDNPGCETAIAALRNGAAMVSQRLGYTPEMAAVRGAAGWTP